MLLLSLSRKKLLFLSSDLSPSEEPPDEPDDELLSSSQRLRTRYILSSVISGFFSIVSTIERTSSVSPSTLQVKLKSSWWNISYIEIGAEGLLQRKKIHLNFVL